MKNASDGMVFALNDLVCSGIAPRYPFHSIGTCGLPHPPVNAGSTFMASQGPRVPRGRPRWCPVAIVVDQEAPPAPRRARAAHVHAVGSLGALVYVSAHAGCPPVTVPRSKVGCQFYCWRDGNLESYVASYFRGDLVDVGRPTFRDCREVFAAEVFACIPARDRAFTLTLLPQDADTVQPTPREQGFLNINRTEAMVGALSFSQRKERTVKISRSCSLGIAGLTGIALLAFANLSPQLLAGRMVPYSGAGWGTPLDLTIVWPTAEDPDGEVFGTLAETGEATHFGRYEAQMDVTGYFGWEGEVLVLYFSSDNYVQVAADGSSITASVIGREPLIGAPTPFTMTITIVEGTGRFEQATGSWEVSALSTGDYTYTSTGTISSVGSVRSQK